MSIDPLFITITADSRNRATHSRGPYCQGKNSLISRIRFDRIENMCYLLFPAEDGGDDDFRGRDVGGIAGRDDIGGGDGDGSACDDDCDANIAYDD